VNGSATQPEARQIHHDPRQTAHAQRNPNCSTGDPSGDRLSRDPEAAREVAALCGHLPLALRIAAVLLVDDPAQPVSELASVLRDKRHRLAELQYGDDLAVRTAFDLSYSRLSAPERRLFRLLSLAPGQQVSVWTAMALAKLEKRDTSRLLAALCRAHMLQQSETRSWYRFHDLIRLYAVQKSEEEDSPKEVDDAIGRMLVELYEVADNCVDLLSEKHGVSPEAAERRKSASAWLHIERQTMVEAVELAHRSGRQLHTMLLANPVSRYLRDTRRFADAARVLELGLDSAVEQGNTSREATLRCDLANALRFLNRKQESLGHLTRAVQISRELGNRKFEGVMLMELGEAHRGLGDTAKAIEHYRVGLEIATEAGDAQWQGNVQMCIGAAREDIDDFDGAVDSFNRALRLFHQTDSLSGIASTHRVLAAVYLERLRRYDLAFDHWDEARQICKDIGDLHSEAEIWYMLSLTCLRADWRQLAQTAWQAAMLLAKKIEYHGLVEDLEFILTKYDMSQATPADD
jgi:tetratricopeptide (TPR) repeat protein